MLFEKLEQFSLKNQPLVLVIGTFDGMHRGHCAILQQAQLKAEQGGSVVVLTFRGHPSEVLRPTQPTPLLCTLEHKLHLIQEFGIDNIVLLPFTRYLARHSAESFVENIRQFIPFSHLVLGRDATIGREKQGNPTMMNALGMQWGFILHYVDEYRYEGKPVSSTRIREALQKGDFACVEELLNRPYSIYAKTTQCDHEERTFFLEIKGLCLPPSGIYHVNGICGTQQLPGIAEISINENGLPQVQVHFSQAIHILPEQFLEIIFRSQDRMTNEDKRDKPDFDSCVITIQNSGTTLEKETDMHDREREDD